MPRETVRHWCLSGWPTCGSNSSLADNLSGKADVGGYLHVCIVQPHCAILIEPRERPRSEPKEDRHDGFDGTSDSCRRLLLGCAGSTAQISRRDFNEGRV